MPMTSRLDAWTARGHPGGWPVTVRVDARLAPWSASDHGGMWPPGTEPAGVLRATCGDWCGQWVMPSLAMAIRHGMSLVTDPAILQDLTGWTVGRGQGMNALRTLDTARVWFANEADLAALLIAEAGAPRYPLNAGDIARTAAHVATWVGTHAITVDGLNVDDVAKLVEAVQTMANKPTVVGEVGMDGARYVRVLTSGIGAGASYKIATGVSWYRIAHVIMHGGDVAAYTLPMPGGIPNDTNPVMVGRMQQDGHLYVQVNNTVILGEDNLQ